jgi:hypothetical protein
LLEDAVKEANRLRTKFPGETFDAYGCHCGGFHVGHRPKKTAIGIETRRAG